MICGVSIGEAFHTFCDNLLVTNGDSISYRYKRITNQLNRDFYGYSHETWHSIYTGSYGRDTAITGFSDMDILFWLPSDDFARFDNYSGNGQSAMLQEVRSSIKTTYPSSEIGADGQVVVVEFDDGLRFEVAPGFELVDDRFKCPNSNSGGSWYITDPRAEQAAINKKNAEWNHNLKRLGRMGRAWRRMWNVPIGGLLIDTFAHTFLGDWEYRDKSYVYYDWMSRDFFAFMMNQSSEQAYWLAPGSNQYVWRTGDFEYKAKRCYNISLEAIEADSKGYEYTRNVKWREIYGTYF
jgi:hypothetical protein